MREGSRRQVGRVAQEAPAEQRRGEPTHLIEVAVDVGCLVKDEGCDGRMGRFSRASVPTEPRERDRKEAGNHRDEPPEPAAGPAVAERLEGFPACALGVLELADLPIDLAELALHPRTIESFAEEREQPAVVGCRVVVAVDAREPVGVALERRREPRVGLDHQRERVA